MSRDRQLAAKACKAMEPMGFSKDVTNGVLRSLLKTYENSWEFITADNYRVLVEALLDQSAEPHPQEEGGRIRKNREGEEMGMSKYPTSRPATTKTPVSPPSPSLRSPSIQTQGMLSRDRQLAAGACQAVEPMGFSKDLTNGVLGSLLSTYENSWEFITADNYRVLVEALLEGGWIRKNREGEEMGNSESECKKMTEHPLPGVRISGSPDAATQKRQRRELDGTPQQHPEKGKGKQIVLTPRKPLVRPRLAEPVSPQASFIREVPEASSTQPPQGSGRLELTPNRRNCRETVEATNAEQENEESTQLLMRKRGKRPADERPGTSYVRRAHDTNDISRGEESVRIPLDCSTETLPSSFYYIPQNIRYQNAYSRVGDEDCCADCYGDCLAAPIPCACARETGGEFAYTQDGLVKKKFLDECIQDPRHDGLFYCKSCPLERSKNEVMPDSCKGHTLRKFIKECWSKCGCNKRCGNRLVQRGITCNLQVFHTDDGKGFGVRTLDDLPRGTFVFEYVGEILTNVELYDRNLKVGNARHTYPVLLDADWRSEGLLRDEDALCLDATFYGNVARFVNHR